jgi:hypothetical protein
MEAIDQMCTIDASVSQADGYGPLCACGVARGRRRRIMSVGGRGKARGEL